MKRHINKAYLIMSNADRERLIVAKKEASVRRRNTKKWDFMVHHINYQKAAVKASYRQKTVQLKEVLFDGIFLDLHERNENKSYSYQKRILRRIVEKRQAQSTRRRIGRTEDKLANHLIRHYTSKCMKDLQRYHSCI